MKDSINSLVPALPWKGEMQSKPKMQKHERMKSNDLVESRHDRKVMN